MDFELSPEQAELKNSVLQFAQKELGADLLERDARGTLDSTGWRRDWQKCAEFGLLGMLVPGEFGGSGLGFGVFSAILALEALGEGCADNGLGLGIGGQMWAVLEPVLAFGNVQQKKHYLPGLCDGSLVGSLGLAEAGAGSDIMSLSTTAKSVDDGYILNGSKALISMAPVCDVAVIFALTAPERGVWGISAFLLEATDAGFTRGRPENKIGMRTIPLGDMLFTDCWIPSDRLLGKEGSGMSIFQYVMEWERGFILSGHVGSMARQLKQCTDYARERKTSGKPILEFQSVSNRLADMRLRLETCRLLLYKMASLKEHKKPCKLEASMVNLHISEAFVASSMDAIRINGGRGFLSDMGVEHNLRDAVGGVLYSGTSDIQRQIIAQLLD